MTVCASLPCVHNHHGLKAYAPGLLPDVYAFLFIVTPDDENRTLLVKDLSNDPRKRI